MGAPRQQALSTDWPTDCGPKADRNARDIAARIPWLSAAILRSGK
jgi:hypothetical protein